MFIRRNRKKSLEIKLYYVLLRLKTIIIQLYFGDLINQWKYPTIFLLQKTDFFLHFSSVISKTFEVLFGENWKEMKVLIELGNKWLMRQFRVQNGCMFYSTFALSIALRAQQYKK